MADSIAHTRAVLAALPLCAVSLTTYAQHGTYILTFSRLYSKRLRSMLSMRQTVVSTLAAFVPIMSSVSLAYSCRVLSL